MGEGSKMTPQKIGNWKVKIGRYGEGVGGWVKNDQKIGHQLWMFPYV